MLQIGFFKKYCDPEKKVSVINFFLNFIFKMSLKRAGSKEIFALVIKREQSLDDNKALENLAPLIKSGNQKLMIKIRYYYFLV